MALYNYVEYGESLKWNDECTSVRKHRQGGKTNNIQRSEAGASHERLDSQSKIWDSVPVIVTINIIEVPSNKSEKLNPAAGQKSSDFSAAKTNVIEMLISKSEKLKPAAASIRKNHWQWKTASHMIRKITGSEKLPVIWFGKITGSEKLPVIWSENHGSERLPVVWFRST